MKTSEVNFDGLIGPTHNFAGLSHGNLASMGNKGRVSNPRNAALQGLRKMRRLHELGLKQALLPPLYRPDFDTLKRLGFSGSKERMLHQLAAQPIELIAAFFSASSMWTANAATVSPSADTADGRVHLTPANLTSKLHRSLEPPGTLAALQAIFRDERKFAVHDPLPSNACYGDEGAANHARFADAHGAAGVELFIHGRRAFGAAGQAEPRRFAARQTLEASQAVARLHGLRDSATVHAQQNPEAIDAGAFHNDVVSVGNLDLLFYHEQAFADEKALLGELQAKFTKLSDRPLRALRVSAADVPLEDAVKSYLFNSQLLRLPDGKTLLLAPIECEENARVRAYLEGHVGKGSGLDRLEVVDLRESMQNGGGPACLRLRVALTDAELAAVNPGVLLDEAKLAELEGWVGRHYRDRLEAGELCDPKLVEEVETALDELTKILTLGSIYPFQS